MSRIEALPPPLDRIESRALLVGAVAAVILLIGLFLNPGHAFRSYLFGYLFVLAYVAAGITFWAANAVGLG